ncbi:GNAT family N-acetyltransferase [Demequina zhanjiangensis]|uniref:GNAT family protein n=1 Tax=Demequina zhanjiangensis TaxID=3051659 RepID=A0ABT8FYL0_9MICO|nr:GNAT family protein [Demequina sp. SYSU T00b26]MDN4471912.1 GNAT family protein [Demequina sp. SYSU T00b26]
MATELRLFRDGIVLRRLRRRDEREWLALRDRNREWLRPWEATAPPGQTSRAITFGEMVRREAREWRRATAYPMAIEVEGALVGRVSVTGITWGPECGGSIGYWVSEHRAGEGIAPRAVTLAADYAYAQGLHRLEIAMRPDNVPSIRVARKVGFRDEGLRRSYLYIDGAWRDHRVFALTAQEPRPWHTWTRPQS